MLFINMLLRLWLGFTYFSLNNHSSEHPVLQMKKWLLVEEIAQVKTSSK